MNKACLVCLMLGIFPGFTLAAPAAPLVQFPAGDAAWTVDITRSGSAPPPPAPGPNSSASKQAKKVEVTQVSNIRRIVITWIDGTVTERWTIPGLNVYFKQYPDGSVNTVVNGGVEGQLDNANAPCDLSAFSWITPDTLQEKDPVSYEGKQCYHYAGNIAMNFGGRSSISSAGPKTEAWIDSTTLLPVGLNLGSSNCVFTFATTPPAGPLVMPPDFQKELHYYKLVMGLR